MHLGSFCFLIFFIDFVNGWFIQTAGCQNDCPLIQQNTQNQNYYYLNPNYPAPNSARPVSVQQNQPLLSSIQQNLPSPYSMPQTQSLPVANYNQNPPVQNQLLPAQVQSLSEIQNYAHLKSQVSDVPMQPQNIQPMAGIFMPTQFNALQPYASPSNLFQSSQITQLAAPIQQYSSNSGYEEQKIINEIQNYLDSPPQLASISHLPLTTTISTMKNNFGNQAKEICSNIPSTTPNPNQIGYITIPPNIYANPYVAPFRASYPLAPRFSRNAINGTSGKKKSRVVIDSETRSYQSQPSKNSYVLPKKYDENGCYETGDGHKCCNSDLEQTIHDSYDCLMSQMEFKSCGIGLISAVMQKAAQKRFGITFETIIADKNFVTKVSSMGNYSCRLEKNGQHFLVYAAPEQYDLANKKLEGAFALADLSHEEDGSCDPPTDAEKQAKLDAMKNAFRDQPINDGNENNRGQGNSNNQNMPSNGDGRDGNGQGDGNVNGDQGGDTGNGGNDAGQSGDSGNAGPANNGQGENVGNAGPADDGGGDAGLGNAGQALPAVDQPPPGGVGQAAAGASYPGGVAAAADANSAPEFCFSGDTTVTLADGLPKRLDELQIGDWIVGLSANKRLMVRVDEWIHRKPSAYANFLKIGFENGNFLKITAKHYIFKIDCQKELVNVYKSLVTAEKLNVGDCLITENENFDGLKKIRIKSISNVIEKGYYSPDTSSGNLMVNGVFASCFSDINNEVLFFSRQIIFKIYSGINNFIFNIFRKQEIKEEVDILPGIDVIFTVLETIMDFKR